MPSLVTRIVAGGQSETLLRSTIVYSDIVGPVMSTPIGIMPTTQ